MQPEYAKLSDEDTKQLVREELRDLLGVSGTPDFEVVARGKMQHLPNWHRQDDLTFLREDGGHGRKILPDRELPGKACRYSKRH